MKITQVRNATIIIEYAEKKILIDPMLAPKGTYEAFGEPLYPPAPRQNERNPLVELPISIEKILDKVDFAIITHLHLDHYDTFARDSINKDKKIFVQNAADKKVLENDEFTNVEILTENSKFEDITLIKTKGEHGRGEILKAAGETCGIVFKNENEKTLYVAGDTVWYDEVKNTIDNYKPEVIVVNGGDNQFNIGGSLVMGKEDIYETYKSAPKSIIISSHMEAVNHWTLSRQELREFIKDKQIENNVLVPEDGESYEF